MERNYRDFSPPSAADLAKTDRGNCTLSLLLLGQWSLMIYLEGRLMVHHHRLGTGTPLCSRLTKEEEDCCGGDAYWKAGLLRLVGKPSRLLDRERESQSQRFDRDAPLLPSRGQNWEMDFASGSCPFHHHFLRYCIVLMKDFDLGPPPADDRYAPTPRDLDRGRSGPHHPSAKAHHTRIRPCSPSPVRRPAGDARPPLKRQREQYPPPSSVPDPGLSTSESYPRARSTLRTTFPFPV